MIRRFIALGTVLAGISFLSYVCTANAGSTGTNSTATNVKTPSANSGMNGLLTDQDVGQLQTEWTDPATGTKLIFSASFSRRELNAPEDKAPHMRYVRLGKVPYRITVTLLQQEKDKRGMALITNGNATFYVTDSEGKVVTKPQTQELDKLCPS
jgi:hypothetical protein